MKNQFILYLILLILLVPSAMKGQMTGGGMNDYAYSKPVYYEFNKNTLRADIGLIPVGGGLDIGATYIRNINNHLGWDVIKMKFAYLAESYPRECSEISGLYLLSGFHGMTSRFGVRQNLYFSGGFRVGINIPYDYYCYNDTIDVEEAPFFVLETTFDFHIKSFLIGMTADLSYFPYFGLHIGWEFPLRVRR